MKQDAKRPHTQSDSFFGMALAQAFMGFAFGAEVDAGWEAAEIASTIRNDRKAPKFELGAKKSLGGDFARMAGQTLAELDRASFIPSFAKPQAPTSAMAFC